MITLLFVIISTAWLGYWSFYFYLKAKNYYRPYRQPIRFKWMVLLTFVTFVVFICGLAESIYLAIHMTKLSLGV